MAGNRTNIFTNNGGSQTQSIGAGSYVNYVVAVYELAPDEALIVETELPEDPLYWNILTELRKHLPADTPVTSAEERRRILRNRRHSGYRRWNI